MSFWDNVKKFAQPYADDDFDEFEDPDDAFEQEPALRPGRRTPPTPTASAPATPPPAAEDRTVGSKVLNMSSNKPGMVLLRPISFSDAVKAADELRERKAIIVNLENLDKTVARRVIDFLSGCCYALDGKIQKIAYGTYLFCPHSMDIGGDLAASPTSVDTY